jgi:hypothetical protein
MEVSGWPHTAHTRCPFWYSKPWSSNPQSSHYTICAIPTPTLPTNQTIKYWMTGQQWFVNRMDMEQSGYYTSISLEGLTKNTRNFTRYSWCPTWNLNQACSRYKSRGFRGTTVLANLSSQVDVKTCTNGAHHSDKFSNAGTTVTVSHVQQIHFCLCPRGTPVRHEHPPKY